MAIGDVVVDIFVGASGNYQPAAGVEACITSISTTAALESYNVYDGTNLSEIQSVSDSDVHPIRLYVDNTNYLRYVYNSTNGHYSGVIVG